MKIDAGNLNIFLETPVVLVEGETLPAYSRYCRLPTNYRETEATLFIPGRGFKMQSYPARALDRRLQVDWARDPREGPRVLMSLRVDFEPMG